ncbi:MAG: D-aminoacyl-tRNA deacylase [Treponema sp.]|nr:D-aminoacyl-tRNA deacylase [Treponema sp.]MCL2250286.1 D-aminoacyl-tRNA deacylase [Treponema sp.]
MKAVIQRVKDASVTVDDIVKGKIESGLLVYLGVAHDDSEKEADWLSEKIVNLRIFNDSEGKMNLSLKDLNTNEIYSDFSGAKVLMISQFTLLADARKGRRPSWNGAAPPEKAKSLYEYFIKTIKNQGLVCKCGEFQAHMMVSYTNDGPVTIILDTKEN